MELVRIAWDMFAETGDISLYLLYKTVSYKEQKAKEDKWELSEKKVLS